MFEKEVDDDFSLFKVGKWQFAAVHGDKDRAPAVVKNLTLMTDRKFHCIITAHKHHFSADEQNGCIVIANPSLIGVDEYSKNLRLTSSPAQTLIMVGEHTPVECIYYLNLSE
jgi:predicted phosphodiesterase